MKTVYFIRAENGLIKIGCTSNLGVRVAELYSSNACEIQVIGVMPGDENTKLELQQAFAQHRHHGEWYEPNSDLSKYIDTHCVAAQKARVKAHLDPLLTIRQVAELLGVSVITVRRMVQDKNLPYYRVGRQLRFDPNAITEHAQVQSRMLTRKHA